MAAFITKEAPGVSQRCHQCRKAVTFCTIRCSTCKEVSCQDCDFNHHLTRPFHNRQCMKLDLSLPLKPTQFLDADCEMFETSMQYSYKNFFEYLNIFCILDVPVPVFCPEECSNCNSNETLKCKAGNPIPCCTREFPDRIGRIIWKIVFHQSLFPLW